MRSLREQRQHGLGMFGKLRYVQEQTRPLAVSLRHGLQANPWSFGWVDVAGIAVIAVLQAARRAILVGAEQVGLRGPDRALGGLSNHHAGRRVRGLRQRRVIRSRCAVSIHPQPAAPCAAPTSGCRGCAK